MTVTSGECAAAKAKDKPYKLSDGQNMYLLVAVAGSKTWKWGYKLFDPVENRVRQYDATLGTYPDLDPKKARIARQKAAEYVARGEHPPKVTNTIRGFGASKKLVNHAGELVNGEAASVSVSVTVWGAVDAWLKFKTPEWSAGYAAQARHNLTKYAGPETTLGRKPYAEVKRPELFELLEAIGQSAPSVARLVKQWLTAVFDRLVDSGRLPYSPLAGMKTKNAIPTTKTKNSPVLLYPALRELLECIRGYRERRMAIFLELLARTCVRSSELRLADWEEFDLQKGLWVIPAERMKMRTLHVVPLSAQAIALLEELKEYEGGKGRLFPHAHIPGESMVLHAPREAIYRAYGRKFSPHGLRSTFSTHAHEAGMAPHLVEAALAHQERNATARAYNRSTFLEERRGLMAWWSDELDMLMVPELEPG